MAYQNDLQKVLTGEVRMSYVSVLTPRASKQGGDPKYSVTLLIPKTDTATKADIEASIQAAASESLTKAWGGVRPPNLRFPLYDGDGVRPSGVPFGDECKGHWVVTAATKMKPQVIGMDGNDILPSDIYSGMYGRATIRFFGYSSNGNKGIGCGLGNIMKTREGDPLAGNASAASDFAGICTPSGNGGCTPASMGYAAPAYAPPANINPLTGQPI